MTTARRIAVALEAAGLMVVRPDLLDRDVNWPREVGHEWLNVLGCDVQVDVGEVMVSVDFHDFARRAVHQEMWLSMGLDYIVKVIENDCGVACSLFPC